MYPDYQRLYLGMRVVWMLQIFKINLQSCVADKTNFNATLLMKDR